MLKAREKQEDKKPEKKIPATAPGQALGYGLQYTRLTALLLQSSEGTFCSLEVMDDVAKESSTGEVTLSQTKSALSRNPVSNKATDLWKTFQNWSSVAKQGLVDPENTKFEIYVSKPAQGEIVNAFSSSGTTDEAKQALALAKKILWGEAPEYKNRSEISQELSKYIDPLFGTDNNHVVSIIKNFHLECGSGSPQNDIETSIRGMLVSLEKVTQIADHACGWVKRKVDQLLESNSPAVLSRDEFHHGLTTFVRKIDRDLILESIVRRPTVHEQLTEMPRTFVRQLELIELDYDDKLEAITDFLRASGDRTAWSQKGYVDESSFIELDENLYRSWKNMKRRVEVETSDSSKIDQGKVLYSDCMEHSCLVQGMEPPGHFIPGCFHCLSDDQRIGWHPESKKFLSNTTSPKLKAT